MKPASTLSPPPRPENLHANAHWLAGEGAGSWFVIEPLKTCFHVKRFSPLGKLECEGEFIKASDIPFDATKQFEVTYLSHCEQVTVIQNSYVIVLRRISKTQFASYQP